METKSYEYNGKRYDFVLSLRAKIEIEKLQKKSQAGITGNPEVVAAGMKVNRLQERAKALATAIAITESLLGTELTDEMRLQQAAALDKLTADRDKVNAEMEDAQAAVIPFMDQLSDVNDTDPLEIGFIVASNYGSQRDEVTRDLFNSLVDDMDKNLGVEATYEFFVDVQDQVFTQLNAMEAMKQTKDQAREETRKFLNQK